MGIEGLGAKSVGGTAAQLPGGPALVADLDNLGFQINKDNIREVYQLLAQETDRLKDVMNRNGFKLKVDACGTDPVSPEAAAVFTAKLDKLKGQCNNYVTALKNAADHLRHTALSYGYTDDQVKASLTSIPTGPQAAPTSAKPLLPGPDQFDPMGSVARPYLPPTQTTPGPPLAAAANNEMPAVWTPLANHRSPLPGSQAGHR
jgi:hypothetical protein